MKAIVCPEYGPVSNLDYRDVADPTPGPDEVVINARAIGVNFPDGLLVQGLYQMKPETPFVPGMEAAGVVVAVGGNVTHVKPGYRAVALVDIGGYAEKVLAPAAKVFVLPETMSYEDACALMCAWGTAHHALRQRARLKSGETLMVLGGAGSTGMAAIGIGKAIGAHVIAVASTPEKQEACLEAGADVALPYDGLRETLKQTHGRGVDVVFDPVGGPAFDTAARAMARNGRLLVVGFASGEVPRLPVNLALLKEFSLVGVFWGAFTAKEPDVYAANNRELFDWHSKGLIFPRIDERRPLSEAATALQRILDRGAIGKTILVPEG
ncbi:MAG: NADPH:quinone oxidoreductase family protein [Hoeflea sp.]|uniref:NADPH:quinone oxidoreductase family protein n=1 Tax=Hoeflea sp. TaxID=1940281 RepID=UPI001DD87F7F|nr:NADPH:quinone oxidoreductase family protein [Hoeflea sp.]MBU4529428.1 NADPH:quinone oxidoreductase family protein [Alphaproteobacteria bacterium]MBU4546547.1 NADPH:quinone oxidoreductase family protein [Alphaproteobacteria bacterium]MBU4550815.1 NADPH:quinone oxidoreductase family protein [Alphaproteobacteria bacterium]MBV1723757.1 NADPH:quinone oxidoreductase family protein [Hoeflea sp.]MBV1763034.1 NADPH:quinone oxidoreductase family protein [Hoeflea sp.]